MSGETYSAVKAEIVISKNMMMKMVPATTLDMMISVSLKLSSSELGVGLLVELGPGVGLVEGEVSKSRIVVSPLPIPGCGYYNRSFPAIHESKP